MLLEGGSLPDGLRHLGTELRRKGGVEVEVTVADPSGAVDALPIETVAELLAASREALSNVARHASAAHAGVRLETNPDRLRLEITDDGRGSDSGRAGAPRPLEQALGGSFAVESGPDRGTRIILTIPTHA